MEYGFYDNKNREYVITRPDTPAPWLNYLGNGGFSGMITNTAGGLIFNKDSGNHRITRYNFNDIPWDRPGRYLYLRDSDTGEYWSPSWQPVMKTLDEYECRHGMGYTTISSLYNGISSSIIYFIPLKENYEIWKVKLNNTSNVAKNLKLFSYIEFSSYVAAYDIESDWKRYFMTGFREGNAVVFDPSDDWIHVDERLSFIGTDLPMESFDCDRDAFIGKYRDESRPIAVENGYCSNSELNADNCCGSLCCPITLAPGEQKEFVFLVGITDDRNKISGIIESATNLEKIEKQLNEVKEYWNSTINRIQVETPDEKMNTMLNCWHPYQCRMTYNWSRFISYYARGLGRGWGYRDSMQDVLGVIHAVPDEVKVRIKTLLGIQYSEGNARAVYFPGTGESSGGGRSDDHIWGIFSVCSYIKETGDYAFLEEKVPYIDGGEATVYEHLVQGLKFTREHIGAHGLPLFLENDWNDSLKFKEGKAESAFVFFQAAHAAYELKRLFKHLDDKERFAWADEYYDWCKSVYKKLWDGKWFLRGFTDKGEKFGTDDDEFNKIFLNPQSWAVLSRLPSAEEGNSAFENVKKYLFCEMGVTSHAPASSGIDVSKKSFFGLKAGVRENGGIFFHASTWAIIAETILGRNEDAYSLYHRELPTMRNDKVDDCKIEPYVYASSMIAPCHESDKYGVGSWLSGTASWMYVAATQYILGFRPDYDGVIIDPCVPAAWDGFKYSRLYRNITCNVSSAKIPDVGARAKAVIVDGEKLETNFIPYDLIKDKTEVNIEVVY